MRAGSHTKKKMGLRPFSKQPDQPALQKRAVYYHWYCCEQCYFDWGRYFEKAHLYKHHCSESNFKGLLKKYWKPDGPDYSDME